jgi:carbonic anhydrase
MQRHSAEYLKNLTPQEAYQLLVEGNKRFVDDSNNNHQHGQAVAATKSGQYPFAVILSCMDSRTSVELLFDQGIGEVFSIRVAGNIVNEDIIGSIEYAVQHVGSKLVVVLGHTSCGAVKGAIAGGVPEPMITSLLNRIQPAIDKAAKAGDKSDNAVAYANVENSIEEILNTSSAVKQKLEKGEIGIVGGMYDVATGKVDFFKNLSNQ